MDEEAIFKSITRFAQCFGCNHVFPTNDSMQHMWLDWPSPCCQFKGHRGMWPDIGVAQYLETARIQPPGEHGLRVQALMLAPAAELLLNRVMWQALAARKTQIQVAHTLMKRSDGLWKLKDAYRRVVCKSVEDVLSAAGHADFSVAWRELVRFRNAVAHGDWHDHLDPAHVALFSDKLIEAGAVLWNEAAKPPP